MKNIIFDTDIGGDCDDVAALDVLIAAHKKGAARLLGVTYSSDNKNGPACIYAILKRHGLQSLPIGRAPVAPDNPGHDDVYATAVAEAFPSVEAPTYESLPDAARALRKLLAANEHVTFAVTGFLTNIAALLASEPDDISPLNGIELVREKVDEMVYMAGNFAHQTGVEGEPQQMLADGSVAPVCEYNVAYDIPATKAAVNLCPVPVTLLPWEAGCYVLSGKPLADDNGTTPESVAFRTHGSFNGRDSWDPETAMYAVYGAQPWFRLTAGGRIVVDDSGVTHLDTLHGGQHRVLVRAVSKEAMADAINGEILSLKA